MTLPAAVISFVKSPAAPILGVAGVALGAAEIANNESLLSLLIGFASVVGGSGLLILAWLANAIRSILQKAFLDNGQKLIELPTAAQLTADKMRIAEEMARERKTLSDALEAFAREAAEERKEMAKFREALAATLADHGARITAMERRQGSGESPAVR